MKSSLSLLLLLFLSISANAYDIEKELRVLDREVANRQVYIAQKEEAIALIKKNLQTASFAAEQYLFSKQLYEAYLKFDSDSAIAYANRCNELGVKESRSDWQKEAELNIIKVFVLRSFYPVADNLLRQYGPIEKVLPQLRANYGITVLEHHIRLHTQMEGTVYEASCQQQMSELWNTYREYIPTDFSGYVYLEYSMQHYLGIDMEEKLKASLDKQKEYSTQRAMVEMALALQCRQKKDSLAYMHHLIQSSICDIRSANREAMSLLFIIRMLHKPDDIQRAFEYALLCEENAQLYKDHGRSFLVVEAQAVIQRMYKESLECYHRQIYFVILFISVLLAIIVVMFVLLKKKQIKQNEIYRETERVNEKLQEQLLLIENMAQKLEATNKKLVSEIKQRDFSFVNTFCLCSGYIREIKKFKKNICLLLKTGMVSEINRMASSSTFNDSELQKLHRQFDEAFMAIHPDFVERFNQLLRPKEQIQLKESHTLTPELRIYALVYLGITDSVGIADFLHYSPQTVYNYRLKMRHVSCVPEKTFAEAVRNLYVDTPSSACNSL